MPNRSFNENRRGGFFRSLRGRAISLLLGTVVIVAFLAWAVFSPIFAKTFAEEVKKRGQSTAAILEKHQDVRLALSLKNAEKAAAVASAVKAGDKDIEYVILVDASKNPIGHAGLQNVDAMKDVIQLHLSGKPTEEEEQVHRFTQEVRTEKQGGKDDGDLGFGEETPTKATNLGWVLLGLSTAAAQGSLRNQTLSTVLLTAVGLVIVFFVFFRSIEQRLRRAGEFANRVAKGELGAKIQDLGDDEIGEVGDALSEMVEKTSSMVVKMQAGSAALVKASTDILQSSRQQSERASWQAASVTETGATVTQLRQTFQQAAERAQGVIDMAKRSEEATTSGRGSVEQSMAAMQQLSDQVLTISRTMTGLVERTAQIASIIDAVNDLAEQSNVLALNAAIESAKAGEHGRGFAVVAREVRNLAERSKDSTGQVRTMLQDIERASREALSVIEEGNRKARSGMQLAQAAGSSITTLDGAITESSTAAKQIAASTRQQAVGVEQIWQAMRDIDRAVKESANGIRQLEEASANINSLADQMRELVSGFRVN